MSCSPVVDCQLEAVTEAIEELLTDTCTIQRYSTTDDGRGGRPKTYSDLATGVACRVTAARYRPTERVTADQLVGQTTWIIRFPSGQDVTAKDRVVVTSLSNRTFQVDGMLSASSEVIRIVQATEVLVG